MNKNNYLPHVDGLRAIAVLSVILFHLNIIPFSGGYVGVDIFFVISGFLITGILKNELEQTGCLNLKSFYRRRVKRLGPALLVVLFATYLISMLVFSPNHFQRIGGALASSIFSVSNFFFWLEADYFDTSANLKPFLHTWSLSVEEQFYFLWPVSLLILYKLNIRFFVLPLLIFASVSSLFLNFIFADGYGKFLTSHFGSIAGLELDGKSALFFLLPFRMFEFGIGAALVWIFHKRLSRKIYNDFFVWVGLFFICYSVLFFDDQMLFPYWYALIPCLGAAFVIYGGGDAYTKALLSNRVIIFIGLISYSLYLIHWPLIVFWRYLGGGELGFADQLIIGTLTFFLANLSYHFVERPFRRPEFLRSKPVQSIGLLIVALVLIATGVHAYSTDGWAWRAGDPVVNLDKVGDAKEFHKAYYGGAGYPYYGPVAGADNPDIVLMGDSHGRQYADGINEFFVEEKGFGLFVASGTSCFHLPDFTRTTEGYDWDNMCQAKLDIALDIINQASPPPVVIISHSWSAQMPIADILGENKKRRGDAVKPQDIVRGVLELKELIGQAHLIVIGDVPRAGVDLYDKFTRPRSVVFSGFKPEKYLFSVPDSGLMVMNRELSKVASVGVKFIDPFDYLCDAGRCRNTDEKGRLIYSDGGHLSKFGSQFLIGRIQSTIEQVLFSR